jgi:thiamine monophosphate synthase
VRPLPFRLLAITPPSAPVDPAIIDTWERCGALASGLALLLRDPDATPEQILAAEGRLAPLRRGAEARGIPVLLSIDGRALARIAASPALHSLAGLQLRGDPSVDALQTARHLATTRLILGRSCHGEPAGAHQHVDYTCLAPIFTPSTTQRGVDKRGIGLDPLRAWSAQTYARIFALGGINAANARVCVDAGAFGIAGIGLFFGEPAAVAQNVAAAAAAIQARDVQPAPTTPGS